MKFILFLLCCFSLNSEEIVNQTSQTLDQMPSVMETGALKVPLIIANEETLQGYGHIVRNFESEEVIINPWPLSGWRPLVEKTGIGPITEGSFDMIRVGGIYYAENHAVKRRYIIGWFDDPRNASESIEPMSLNSIYTHEANYHPDGGQVFYPKNHEPFVALLALPTDDIKPENFVAFYFDGSFGVQINPNIWHQPVFPCVKQASFYDKQGAVHGCVSVDFIEEFGVYLEVPLPIE